MRNMISKDSPDSQKQHEHRNCDVTVVKLKWGLSVRYVKDN